MAGDAYRRALRDQRKPVTAADLVALEELVARHPANSKLFRVLDLIQTIQDLRDTLDDIPECECRDCNEAAAKMRAERRK
jgi:hypothetical protein